VTGGTEQIIPTKKKLKMAELQFLRADRADIDAYRTQPFVYLGSKISTDVKSISEVNNINLKDQHLPVSATS
jgi:hypothetical protein